MPDTNPITRGSYADPALEFPERQEPTCRRCKGYYAERYGDHKLLDGICGTCADDLRDDEAALDEAQRIVGEQR